MRRRMIYLLAALWLAAVGACAAADNYRWSRDREQAAYSDGAAAGKSVYLLEEIDGDSVLLQTNADGQVEHLYLASRIWEDSVYRKLFYGDALYAVLRAEHAVTNGTEDLYRVARFDKDGKPTGLTPRLRLSREGELTGFWAGTDGFYLTITMDGGEAAGSYYVGKENLAEYTGEEETDAQILDLTLRELVNAGEGRQIVQARYESGQMLLRQDNAEGVQSFEASDQVKDTFYRRKFPLVRWFELRRGRLGFFGEVLVAGYVLLFLLVLLFRRRNYTFYTIAVVETVLLALAAGGSAGVIYGQLRAGETEKSQYGYFYMQLLKEGIGDPELLAGDGTDLYHQDGYYTLRGRLQSIPGMEQSADRFLDVCLVRGSDYQILASTRGYNGQEFEEVYAREALGMLKSLTSGGQKATAEMELEGQTCRVLGIPLPDEVHPEYLLLCVYEEEGMQLREATPYLIYGGVFFLLGSVLSILLLLVQDQQLRRLANAMESVAGGQTQLTKGAVLGKDLHRMWNSLLEISKMIGRINYSRFRTYESCYRFAPKNIEKILGKDSITEVKAGDMVALNGTVAILSSGLPRGAGQDMADLMNRFIGLIEKHQERSRGFFMVGQCNLSAMKLLFMESSVDTVGFGNAFLQEYLDDEALESLNTCILLHYSRFTYGVAGSQKQSFPFLLSGEVQEMERYGAWFRMLGMRLVITEQVKKRERPAGELRYIGYMRPGEDQQMLRLYEVLDACPRRERQMKINTRSKFSRAIELFYQHDFYLARNTFSDVVRENPEDYLAKWYAFACERFLNENHPEEDVGRLRIEEQSLQR